MMTFGGLSEAHTIEGGCREKMYGGLEVVM